MGPLEEIADIDLEGKKTMCLYHIIDRSHPEANFNGTGNCRECIPTKDNTYCSGYSPTIIRFAKFYDPNN